MKICGIICEYNPFHNGHAYLIEQAKKSTGADAVLCLMSGNFVQRGEAAIFEKHARAKHAVLGGADAVIELPTLFATSNAEIFAKGAIHLLSSIPEVKFLAFGAETADKELLLTAAKLLNDEPIEISNEIKEQLKTGVSYAKARAEAWSKRLPSELLTKPNNTLAVEYAKAILAANAKIELCPVQRIGGGYNDERIHDEFSSATAIRSALLKGEIDKAKTALPDFVSTDVKKDIQSSLKTIENFALLYKRADEIKKTLDCTEGLENGLKRAAEQGECEIAHTLTSSRYTTSRLARIILQNALNVTETDIRNALNSPLYLKLLAIKKSNEELLSILGNARFPILIRPRDEKNLHEAAATAYEIDKFADKLYAILSEAKTTDKPVFE